MTPKGSPESSSNRPANFDKIVEHLKQTGLDYSAKLDFQAMANGENPTGIRTGYYPGWTDDDFRALLEELGV